MRVNDNGTRTEKTVCSTERKTIQYIHTRIITLLVLLAHISTPLLRVKHRQLILVLHERDFIFYTPKKYAARTVFGLVETLKLMPASHFAWYRFVVLCMQHGVCLHGNVSGSVVHAIFFCFCCCSYNINKYCCCADACLV